jgi:hypothetical protein
MGDGALYLGLFEQPGGNEFFSILKKQIQGPGSREWRK